MAGTDEVDTQPTLGFQRVIQRAIMHVQSTGNGKRKSPAPTCSWPSLARKIARRVLPAPAGRYRLDVVNFIAHGIKKGEPPEPAKTEASPEGEEGGGERNEKGLAAGAVHPKPEPGGQGRQDRSR